MNDLVLEKAAVNFRSKHGSDNNEPIRLKSLLQKLNVVTVFAPLSEHFSGMALKVVLDGNVERFMLVNTKQSLGKQHFTICHELYHLFIQPQFTSQVCRTGLFDKKADREEYNADIFASNLLLPTEGVLKVVPDNELRKKTLTLGTILQIEHFYSCSRRALLYRLRKLQLITDEQYTNWSMHIKRSAAEYGFQTYLYEHGNNGEVIGDYGVVAKRLYDKNRISESHYYSLLSDLGIDISKIDVISNGEF